MNKLIKPLTIILAITIPAIASADIKLAQLAENEIRVTYNVDDTATNYGRVELERQIQRAAEKVCGAQNLRKAGSIRQVLKNRNCYDKAMADAMNSVSANA